jgi:hypothetical protein
MKNTLLLASAILLACADSASAQVTIYEDSFTNGTVLNPDPLNSAPASTPTIDTGGYGGTPGATWNSPSDVGQAWDSNGSVAYVNASEPVNAFLLFTPVPGQDYTLSAVLSASGNNWLGLGFTSTTSSTDFFYNSPDPNPSPWLLISASGTQTAGTPTTVNAYSSDLNSVATGSAFQGDTYTITLDTSTTAAWTYGVTVTGPGITGTLTILPTTSFATNPTINDVGIGNLETNGTVGNFTLTDTSASSPTPTSYTVVTTPAPTLLLHKGATTTLTTTITNTGTGTADTLDYASLGASSSLGNGISTGSNPSGTALANGGGTALNSQTYTATTAGSDTITNTGTTGTNHALQTAATDNGNTPTTINVYSGLSTWRGTGSTGNWGTSPSDTNFTANWVDNSYTSGPTYGGAPGVTSGFTGVDTATFNNVSGQSAVTVDLNGATPNVNSITFNTPSPNTPSPTSYTIGGVVDTGTITLSGTAPSINVTAGTQTINAPIFLEANTSVNVGSGDQLTLSGVISDPPGDSMTYTGPGTTVVMADNTYTGGTTVSGGTLYVNNNGGSTLPASPGGTVTATYPTSSGTGTGNVTVTGGTLAGSGTIAPTSGTGVTLNGGSLFSGAAQTVTPSSTAQPNSTGITLVNPGGALTSILTVNNANLTFALGANTTAGLGTYNFSAPSTNSTYISVQGDNGNGQTVGGTGEITFTGADSVTLMDLTATLTTNSLALRQAVPYLLIAAGSDNDYYGLVTSSTDNNLNLQLDGNGYVMGVWAGGDHPLTDYTAITINQETEGQTQLNQTTTPKAYIATQLYLYDGDLEVVPEPSTWAMMLGGLALLLFTGQRRRRQL